MYFSFWGSLKAYGLIVGQPWRELDWPRERQTEMRWSFNLYNTEKGRRRGILKYQREYPDHLLYTIEIEVAALLAKSKPVFADGKYESARVKPNTLSTLRIWTKNNGH